MMRLTFVLTMLTAALSWAGGFWLELGNPTASKDPQAKGAIAIVRAVGCHEPQKAKVTAVAEAFINGKMETRPVELVALSTPGMFAVKPLPQKEGTWVIQVTGEYLGVTRTVKIPPTPKS